MKSAVLPWRALSASRGPAQVCRFHALFVVAFLLLATSARAQSSASTSAQGAAPYTVDCSDPANVTNPDCADTQNSAASGAQSQTSGGSTQVYVDNGGTGTDTVDSTTGQRQQRQAMPVDQFEQQRIDRSLQPTDFQRLVRSSTGESLPIFGRDLFEQRSQYGNSVQGGGAAPPSASYIVQPGDQVVLRIAGADASNNQLVVDRNGAIYVPRVGTVQVAGLRYDQLQPTLNTALSRFYRNYTLSVGLGRLRSVQVYVVGEVMRPGLYTLQASSTVISALYASGGTTRQGSLRQLQVRHGGETSATVDLYDFLLRGDSSKDPVLQDGDVVVVPPAGPQVAMAGSVRHPAIFELRPGSNLAELLVDAGGLQPTAEGDSAHLERFDKDRVRRASTVPLTPEGYATVLKDGDVIRFGHVTTAYDKTVTIRGNLANPGRFAWTPGMRLSDIIPERKALLTDNYWNQRNHLGVPTPLFQPLPEEGTGLYGPGRAMQSTASRLQGPALATTGQTPGTGSTTTGDTDQTSTGTMSQSGQVARTYPRPAQEEPAQQAPLLSSSGVSSQPGPYGVQNTNPNINRINVPMPEIDWSYAVIERLDPVTLKSSLIPFNLGRLVMDHDESQNLTLEPNDIVTILSQSDIPVAIDQQTRFVRIEGEVVSAGVYSVRAGETLQDVVRRAGGLTPHAYLYGSSFFRKSAQQLQDERLREYTDRLSLDMTRAAALQSVSLNSGTGDATALAEERSIIAQLRTLHATGRVVLDFRPDDASIDQVPTISLENGDVFQIPSRPNAISVIGAVNGQNVFLYNPARNVGAYIKLAGRPNRIADPKHAFVIRADGSIFSTEGAGFTHHFNDARVFPGDSIVVPEKQVKPGFGRTLAEYSGVLSSVGLAAAVIATTVR